MKTLNKQHSIMNHVFDQDGLLALVVGGLSGLFSFFNNYLLDIPYSEALIKAGITALVVAVLSVVGKYIGKYFVTLFIKWWEKRKLKRKTKDHDPN